MICGKCGNNFSSRGYLLAHTCRVLSDHILLNEDENIQSEHSDELIELTAILPSNISPSVTEYNVVLPMDC